jgi:hypothetical protein
MAEIRAAHEKRLAEEELERKKQLELQRIEEEQQALLWQKQP